MEDQVHNLVSEKVAAVYPNIYRWMFAGARKMSHNPAHYHTERHVGEMIAQLRTAYQSSLVSSKEEKEFFDGLTVEDLRDVLIAICWHDVVYIPGYPYNELKSALAWESYAKANDVGFSSMNISDMINSTKIGYSRKLIAQHPDWALLHDLDYASFAFYIEMITNRPLLRNEFDFITDVDYAEGKLKFLSQLLDDAKDGLFLTPMFQKFNELAMENITREYKHYQRICNQFRDNILDALKNEPPVSYLDQQHDDITLDFFIRLSLILDDWEPEQRLKAFNNLTQLILERIHVQGNNLHDYPSVERVIEMVQNTSEEQRDGVLIKQIASALKRIETYQALMDTTKNSEYDIMQEDDHA